MSRRIGMVLIAMGALAVTFASASESEALGRRNRGNGSCGSWGGNGSWGSNGSHGSFGGRFARWRNGSHGSWGSNGGCGSHGGWGSNGSHGSHGGSGNGGATSNGAEAGSAYYGAPTDVRAATSEQQHEVRYGETTESTPAAAAPPATVEGQDRSEIRPEQTFDNRVEQSTIHGPAIGAAAGIAAQADGQNGSQEPSSTEQNNQNSGAASQPPPTAE
jgi:hypothetical protein